MSNSSAKLLIYESGNLACVKISGRANFTSSVDFKAVVASLQGKGVKCLVLDLTDCVLMDSTFLGVLSGVGLSIAREGSGRPIELMNPNSRILELLENLGVAHLFKVITGAAAPSGGTAASPGVQPDAANPSKEEVTRNCLEAHRILMEISPANVAKFKDVAQFLADELKRAKTETPEAA